MLLEGLYLPMTTPFHADGRLNLRKLEFNAARYSKTPAAGLVVLGEWGEANLLADEETRLVLAAAIAAAANEKVMLAGISRDSVVETLRLADTAAAAGYDAVLVKVPAMLAHRRELMTYFHAVADRAALPVVLASDGTLSVEMAIELARHPGVLGLVDGGGQSERVAALKIGTATVKREVTVTQVFAAVTGRMSARVAADSHGTLIASESLTGGGGAAVAAPAKAGLKTRTKAVGFQVLAGGTAGMLDSLEAGAVGAMPGFGACAPQAVYEVLAAWKDGDLGLAREKQERIETVGQLVEQKLGVAGAKFGADLTGYFGGVPRLPWLPLNGAERSEVEKGMQALRG
jgi:4-hydroxy-2-oxoglutarate aldolase